MYAEFESTIPINLIRPRRRTDGFTPPPDVDVEFVVSIGMNTDSNFYAGLLDEEPTGVFVATYRSHPLGSLVAVALDVPGRNDLLVVNTVVRWHRDAMDDANVPPGMGLEFLHIGTRARGLLKNFARCRPPLLFEV